MQTGRQRPVLLKDKPMQKLRDFYEDSGLRAAAPFLLLAVLLSAGLVLGVLKLSGNLGSARGSMPVAVFDVVKFANAQRALASTFVGRKEDPTEAGTLLLSLSKKTTAAIEKVAGAGTLVLVKQGVVAGVQHDITDAVLTELGLPTNVPTAEPVKYLTDIAPTMLMLPNREPAPTPVNEKSDSNAQVLP